MQRRWFLVFGLVLVILGAAGFILRTKLKPAQAGLLIETTPQSTVYINDEQIGTTPYDVARKPGEINLRLVPITTTGNLAPWGTKLVLAEGIKTVIRRDFGETESQSTGDILSFEKLPGSTPSLAIVSIPDSSQVVIDGETRGIAPLPIDPLEEGEHKILVSHTGFKDRDIMAKVVPGYKLTVIAYLAELEGQQKESTESAETNQEEKKDEIKILKTPTGFLRVRQEPSIDASETARVIPGEKFTVVEESKNGDWYKIEYKDGKKGWISSQYAKKLTASLDDEEKEENR